MSKTSISDFLTNLAGAFAEVETAGIFDAGERSTSPPDRWWEDFDLATQPLYASALDEAWKIWRIRNHPDKGVCSDVRYRKMAALYERVRPTLLCGRSR